MLSVCFASNSDDVSHKAVESKQFTFSVRGKYRLSGTFREFQMSNELILTSFLCFFVSAKTMISVQSICSPMYRKYFYKSVFQSETSWIVLIELFQYTNFCTTRVLYLQKNSRFFFHFHLIVFNHLVH